MNQKIEKKAIKHEFTQTELVELGNRLARCLSDQRGIEDELTAIKSQYKSKLDSKSAEVGLIADKLSSKFELREKEVFAVFRPKDGLKDYYLKASDPSDANIVLTEPMDPSDYQVDLLASESKFDHRSEVELWQPAGESYGKLILGRLEDKWHVALELVLDGGEIKERLDSETRSYKQRKDAVAQGAKRAKDWIIQQSGKEVAKGFEEAIRAAVESQKEVVE